VLSTRARKRHERGLERAEEIVDRTSNKVIKSKKSAANIASRRKGWDEINAQVGTEAAGAGAVGTNKFAGLADGAEGDENVDELDDEMGEAEQAVAPAASTPEAAPVGAPPPPEDNDEEIL
jgi:hypothetical protein